MVQMNGTYYCEFKNNFKKLKYALFKKKASR